MFHVSSINVQTKVCSWLFLRMSVYVFSVLVCMFNMFNICKYVHEVRYVQYVQEVRYICSGGLVCSVCR